VKTTVRSPNLRLSAATTKEVVLHPRSAGEASCPYRLAACGFNFDPPKEVFREYLASIDELVIWRYVVAGSLLWNSGDCRTRVGPGTVLATHQPAPTRVVVSPEGACVLWVLLVGRPAIAYFDQIVARFGRSHSLPSRSEPVKRAEQLVRLVRAGRPRSPFFWSEQCYLWLSAYHRHLETHRIPLQKVVSLPERTLRLLPSLPRTVKSFAVQLGYSPSYFSRQLARKWKNTPGRLLRELRLREASRLLLHSSDRVQVIAARTGYASVPAFITAFKRVYGRTPLDFRHAKR
jgi:AraC-like DNA-binding protein